MKNLTIAEVYGLKENPFEPTGAAVSKYPFVPPANFPQLEQKIEEAGIEKKLYALLVNSPHGAGKSTTMEHLKKKAINGGYLSFRAPVILTRLSNLSIEDFVADIIREASNYGKVEILSRSKYGTSPSILRRKLVDTLSPIALRSKLMLWIVDEFDILADQPEQEQRLFLQFLREVMDDLANKDVPIAFIMSHTRYSSKEFEANLSKQHEPFKSRLVASLPLAYSYDEVKKIVQERLKVAGISERREGDISPFSEEALRSLYDLIISLRGTESLDNFRIFERICHFALIEGAKRELKLIGKELIQELFNQYGLKELPARESRRLSIKTAQGIISVKSKSLMERNEAILQGILKGLSKSTLLGEQGVLKNKRTSFMGHVGEGNVAVSSLSFDLSRQDRALSIFWVLASSKQGVIQAKDIEDVINVAAPIVQGLEEYSHIVLLSYVSSIDVLNIPENPFNSVTWLPTGLSEDLIGLGIGVEEDYSNLAKSFESEIVPRLSVLVTRATRDITAPLSKPAIEVIQTLYIMRAGGHACTKEAVRECNKSLFMRGSLVQERYVKEAVQAGFASEETNQIEPSIPKAHSFLLNLLDQGPLESQRLLKKLGSASDAIVKSAIDLGLVYEEEEKVAKRRMAEFEEKAAKSIESLRKAYEDPTIKQSEAGQWIRWLLDAYDATAKSDQAYYKSVVLWAIQQRAPLIEDEIRRSLSTSSVVITSGRVESIPVTPPGTSTEHKPTQRIETVPITSKPIGAIENAILEIVQASGPLTISEIDSLMRKKGYEADIKAAAIRLVLKGSLKVVTPE